MNFSTPTAAKSGETIAIDVAEASGYTICVASGDGEKVYERIAAAFNAGQKVMLDFQNVAETTKSIYGRGDRSVIQIFSPSERRRLSQFYQCQCRGSSRYRRFGLLD